MRCWCSRTIFSNSRSTPSITTPNTPGGSLVASAVLIPAPLPGFAGASPRGGKGPPEPSCGDRCNTCDPMEGRPTDDAELFARAQRGETAAYEEIVQRYEQMAFRTAYVITGSAADAEDAAQEGFVKAYRALASFRQGAEPRPWLLRIVANEARNRVRSSGRRHQLELRLTEGFRPGDAAPSPEAVAIAADDRRRLLAMVNALSREDRLVIASRYLLQ